MSLTIELASFTIPDDAETTFLHERLAMITALKRAFPGVLAAWLTKQDDGSWLDVVLWRSREEAEEAARRVSTVPEASNWFRHISQSHGLRHVEVAHQQVYELGS